MQKISKLVATVFFIGYFPFAPGTITSAVAMGLYLLVKNNTGLYLCLTVILMALGFWASSAAEKAFGRKDPPEIVIDEFSAMLAVYLFIPFSPKTLLAGFALFRLFDILKIPPLKKLQRLPRGHGIMLDDIAAAILTNILLQVIAYLPSRF